MGDAQITELSGNWSLLGSLSPLSFEPVNPWFGSQQESLEVSKLGCMKAAIRI